MIKLLEDLETLVKLGSFIKASEEECNVHLIGIMSAIAIQEM